MKLTSLILLATTFLSNLAMADLKLEEAKKLTPTFQFVRIAKEKNVYYLEHITSTVIDENGKTSNYGKTGPNFQTLRRSIKMPVRITIEKTGGFGGKIQFLGFGDDDVKTGDFKNLTNLRFGDLFTSYEGSSTNIGLTLIGGGYTTMTSASGATLKEGNGSIAMIGPSGMPVGINTGFEHINFNLTISSPLKAVLVEYDLKNNGDIARRQLDEKKSVVESFDEVAQFELTSTH